MYINIQVLQTPFLLSLVAITSFTFSHKNFNYRHNNPPLSPNQEFVRVDTWPIDRLNYPTSNQAAGLPLVNVENVIIYGSARIG